MFDTQTILAYLTACIAIILVPGPAQFLVLSRTMAEGRRAGIMTGIGLNGGTLFHTAAAAFGLSAVLMTSALAFSIVKYLGVAYLIYLGIRTLLDKAHVESDRELQSLNGWNSFTKAFVIGVLNPKVALFFLAFLPQFVDPARGHMFWQFFILGAILATVDIFYESLLAVTASTIGRRILQNPTFAAWRQRVMGAVLVGLGIRLAFSEHK